jgi:MFS transporter, OFA family, oxalate/formate antiporter
MFLFTPQGQVGQDVSRFRRTILFKDYRFWKLSVAMFCGTLPGLMINGNLKSIGLSFGLSSSTATMAIIFFAIGSAIGRIIRGFVNDQIGRVRSTVLLLSLIALSSVLVLAGENRELGFLIISLIVGLCYGSSFALYPAQVAELVGVKIMGTVYAMVILAHGLAAVVGPGIGGLLFDMTNSFFPALIFAGVVAAVGVVGYSYLGATITSR